MNPIRIFFSSPSDVHDERQLAKEVVARVERRFAHHCKIESLFWEEEPLRATAHFQEEIPNPAKFDIVVLLLWSRLGTSLPKKPPFVNDETGTPFTGTEWEFIEARKEFEATGGEKPALLVYRKKAPIQVSLDNEVKFEEALQQKRSLESFWKRWFVDSEGNFTTASHTFSDRVEFENMLEEHLRRTVKQILEDNAVEPSSITEDSWGVELHGSPFRGLSTFEVNDSELFFGRTKARYELKELLRRRIKEKVPFLLVVGPSGSGKSSLVKAGLVADLKQPDSIGRVEQCRFAEMRPSDCEGNLVKGLLVAIQENSCLPEILSHDDEFDSFYQSVKINPNYLIDSIKKSFDEIKKFENIAATSELRLIILVDQLEEIFTYSAEGVQFFIKLLNILADSGIVWIVSTLRGDFFHRLDDYPELKNLVKPGIYSLDIPTPDELSQMINKPAELAGLTFEKNELTGSSLSADIEKEAAANPYSLPLVEFALELLFQERDRKNILKYSEYKRVGGLSGAIAKRAEDIVETFDEESVKSLDDILSSLVTISSSKAAATAIWAESEVLAKDSISEKVVEQFLKARLFVSKGEKGAAKIRVAHEALIHNWDRFEEIINKNRKFLILKSEVDLFAAKYAFDNDPSLLLWGKRLLEVQDVFTDRFDDLNEESKDFIEKSIIANKEKEEKEDRILRERAESAEKLVEKQKQIVVTAKRGRAVAFTLLSIVLLGAIVSGLLFYRGQQQKNIINTYENVYSSLNEIDEMMHESKKDEKIELEEFDRIYKAIIRSKKGMNGQASNFDKDFIGHYVEQVGSRYFYLYSAYLDYGVSDKNNGNVIFADFVDEAVNTFLSVDELVLLSNSSFIKNAFSKSLEEMAVNFYKKNTDDRRYAINYYENAIKLREHTLKHDPHNADCKCIIAKNYFYLSELYVNKNENEKALFALDNRLKWLRELEKDYANTSYAIGWKESIATTLLSKSKLPGSTSVDSYKYAQDSVETWLSIKKKSDKKELGIISGKVQLLSLDLANNYSTVTYNKIHKIIDGIAGLKYNKKYKKHYERELNDLFWMSIKQKDLETVYKIIETAKNKKSMSLFLINSALVSSAEGRGQELSALIDQINTLENKKSRDYLLKEIDSRKNKFLSLGYVFNGSIKNSMQEKRVTNNSPKQKEPAKKSATIIQEVTEPTPISGFNSSNLLSDW